ncbi:MAG: DUF2723 domain-containing protein [Bacteroidales bacterium]
MVSLSCLHGNYRLGILPEHRFFLIVGRVFSMFALGDQSKAALAINIMSAMAAAFTIMFLFWTITHIVRKIVASGSEKTEGKV